MFKKYRSYFIIVFILILLQILEWVIFRNFSYSLNSNAIFGSLSVPIIFISITCLIFLILTISVKKYQFGLGLLFAGSFSNLLDRLFYRGVVDYLKISHIPTFNVADVIITFGAILIILALLFSEEVKEKQKTA